MDFIERIFHISPDGGTGALELFLFLIPVAGLLAVYALRTLWRTPREREQ